MSKASKRKKTVSKKVNRKKTVNSANAANPKTDPKASVLFPIVALGASAGGLEALLPFLKHLPLNTGMAFIYVQHQDPKHRSALPEILSKATKMPVQQVQDKMPVRPNRLYVIPANADLEIRNEMFHLSIRTEERGRHMPIDRFFKSLAEARHNKAIGVILSGTASDGTLGLKAIKSAGGITFAQMEKTARYADMPRNAIAAGVVDFVRSPKDITIEIARIAHHPHLLESFERRPEIQEEDNALREIYLRLRKATGVDFSQYKSATIHRRLSRRMVLHKIQKLENYLSYLNQNPNEIPELYNDILIHVTSFFRDPDVFESLKKEVFPELLKDRREGSIRIWVPGCSTGEEAYSIAIALLEFTGMDISGTPIQIFATDVSDLAIEKARLGIYPLGIVEDISQARLERFFVKTDRGYQISKLVRDRCIFARHNVVKDPPFTKLDLISCRNLLIYLNQQTQKKILPVFHYALNPKGYLVLGSSEAISTSHHLFTSVDKKNKVYIKNPGPGRVQFDMYEARAADRIQIATKTSLASDSGTINDVLREGERLILTRFGPASVIIDENMEILHFRGRVGTFLEPPQGQPSLNLLKMAREGILTDLRRAVQEARRTKSIVKKEGLVISTDGESTRLNLEVVPFTPPPSNNQYYLILFESVGKHQSSKQQNEKKRTKSKAVIDELAVLYQELAGTKEYLRSVIEEQEALNEELKAANEEMLSSNEELQSTNEELETAKEELQSANEELITLNEELQNRNSELNAVNDDWNNLIRSLQLPMLMVDRNLKISRFTPAAEAVFNLIPADLGRPVTDMNLKIFVNLERMMKEVMETRSKKTIEIQDDSGRWYSLQIHPYRRGDERIDGAVLILLDISQTKKEKEEVKQASTFLFNELCETVTDAVLVLDSRFTIRHANKRFYDRFNLSPDEIENRPLTEIGNSWNIAELRKYLDKIIEEGTTHQEFQIQSESAKQGRKKLFLSVRRIKPDAPTGDLILLAIRELTS